MNGKNTTQRITRHVMAVSFLFVSIIEPTLGTLQNKFHLNANDLNRHSNSLFQVANDFVTQKSSTEIWGRVRKRLDLNSAKSSNLYQKHLKNYSNSQDYINKVIRNASPYLYYILEEVEKRGMPSEIALLPIVESDFNPNTLSNKGALGLWQIMPSLGHLHGLKQNSNYDGRKDIYESTKVALDHLSHLHKKFDGNWLLAIAAYNCGEGALMRAINKNRNAKKPTDFWSLPLPTETKHFVPKLLALAAIIKSPSVYGVVLPSIPNQPVITRVKMSKTIDIAHAAKIVDISETQLRRLNPGHKSNAIKVSQHLVVPIQKASLVQTAAPAQAPITVAKEEKPVKETTKKKKTSTKKAKAKAKKKSSVAVTKSQTSHSDVVVVRNAPQPKSPFYGKDRKVDAFAKYQRF